MTFEFEKELIKSQATESICNAMETDKKMVGETGKYMSINTC